MTVISSGGAHACDTPGLGCDVATFLTKASVVPPVPNWLLITAVVVLGVWSHEKRAGR